MDVEILRKKCEPRELRVLFVGESPPANGTFFYAADSTLFKKMASAFAEALGKGVPEGPAFLEYFREAGCYLEDLCLDPVNRMKPPAKRRAQLAAVAPFAERLKAHQEPAIVIAVVIAIEDYVKRALALAGLGHVALRSVSFPGRWDKGRFTAELVPLLTDLKKRRVLQSPRPILL